MHLHLHSGCHQLQERLHVLCQWTWKLEVMLFRKRFDCELNHVSVCLYVCMSVSVCEHVCVHICVCVCMYVCVWKLFESQHILSLAALIFSSTLNFRMLFKELRCTHVTVLSTLTDSSVHVCMSSNPMDALLKLSAQAYSAQLSRITATGVCWPGLL